MSTRRHRRAVRAIGPAMTPTTTDDRRPRAKLGQHALPAGREVHRPGSAFTSPRAGADHPDVADDETVGRRRSIRLQESITSEHRRWAVKIRQPHRRPTAGGVPRGQQISMKVRACRPFTARRSGGAVFAAMPGHPGGRPGGPCSLDAACGEQRGGSEIVGSIRGLAARRRVRAVGYRRSAARSSDGFRRRGWPDGAGRSNALSSGRGTEAIVLSSAPEQSVLSPRGSAGWGQVPQDRRSLQGAHALTSVDLKWKTAFADQAWPEITGGQGRYYAAEKKYVYGTELTF